MNRELKLVEAKVTNPSLLYIRELGDRNVNEESHTPSIKQSSPGPTHVHGATQNPKTTDHFQPPIIQSTPASISSILPWSSLELDTNHGEIIDETIKHVTQTLKQTLMTSNPCNTSTNKDLIDHP